jgi:hypothetical protein
MDHELVKIIGLATGFIGLPSVIGIFTLAHRYLKIVQAREYKVSEYKMKELELNERRLLLQEKELDLETRRLEAEIRALEVKSAQHQLPN